MTDNEFLVIFPDKGTLETFSGIASLELPIHNLKVKIQKSNVDPTTSSVLQTCWVKISNIPPIARDEAVIRELATLVGQPIVVDELSLIRDEPARVKVICRDPSAIRCVIEIFFNKVGHEVKFISEGPLGNKNLSIGGPSGSGKDDDQPGRRDHGDKKDTMNKKKSDKFDRFGKIDKEHDSHGDSQEAMEEDNFSESSEYSSEKIQEQVIPIAAFHHSIGVLQLTEREDEIMVGDSQI